jgi:hypothetical protein
MTEETGKRFVLDDGGKTAIFVYRPPEDHKPQFLPATLNVKFAQRMHFLDPWGFMLIGRTKWQRAIFRLKHPIVYSKRGLRQLWRKIKRVFVKPRMIQPHDKTPMRQQSYGCEKGSTGKGSLSTSILHGLFHHRLGKDG